MHPGEPQPIPIQPSLPVPRTSFVGRGRALAEIKRLLEHSRLLTLTGSGGCGKTRLALRLAEQVAPTFTDGVVWIDLAALSDARLLPQTVAAALGLREQPGRLPEQAIREYLHQHYALLVLDNCEHLRSACAELLHAVSLAGCSSRVLATSRRPLRAVDEQVFSVPLLDIPGAPTALPSRPEHGSGGILAELAAIESVRLFVERAQTVAPGWRLHERNAEHVAAICRRLEGLALAIELAAARSTVLTPKEIAERLDRSVSFLTRGAYGSDARHHMLRAAIDWSFDLLAAPEQSLLARLAAFTGSFGLRAVEDVCAGAGLERDELLDLLATLVETSLLVAAEHGDEMRYRLLEPIRQYAVERLGQSGQEHHWRERHARFFVALAEHAAPMLNSNEQLRWLERLEREHDNALAALVWCASSGRIGTGLQLCSLLHPFWELRGYLSLGQRRLGEFLARVDDTVEPELHVRALNARARLFVAQSDFAAARTCYQQSLLLAQHAEDEAGIERALIGLGATLWDLGDFPAARSVLEEAVAMCRESGHAEGLASAYCNLGLVHQYRGAADEARFCYGHALAYAREAGNRTLAAITLMNLANLAMHGGDYSGATARYSEALAAYRELGDRSRSADTLLNLGQLHVGLVELEPAEACFTQAEQIYRALNNQADQGYVSAGRGDIAFYRNEYAPARTHYQHALHLFQAAGNRRLIGRSLGFLGYIAVREGRLKQAAELCAEALVLRRAIGHQAGLVFALDHGYIELALALGRPAVAARLLGAVEAAREALGRPRTPIEARVAAELRAVLASQLGETNFVSVANQGRALSLDQAAAYALDSLSPASIDQPAPALRIFALGPVRVYRGGRLLSSADWTYTKARELVLLLLFRPHATREQLGAELWPEASSEQVRKRFSAALAHARNALGRDTDWINLQNGRYSFNRTQPVWIDVDAFEAGLFQAQLLLRSSKQDERAAGLLSEAVALYSNDFACDVHDGEWHVARREALRHAFLEALLSLGRLHGKAGRDEQAIAVFQRALAADSFLEEAHHELISAYARLGKRSQAFAQYHRLQAALAELHAEPSPETMALIESLQHGDAL